MVFVITVIIAIVHNVQGMQCPDGSPVYEIGISDQGKMDVIKYTNEKRQMILNGTVINQPKGRDIVMTQFDEDLASEARSVSQTCQMKHVRAKDSRWRWVGQNLYIKYSSVKSTGQNWKAAVESWFAEHKNFIYPNKSTGIVGHYTQLIWYSSRFVGCDFISFFDKNRMKYPYAKLYSCNYGPGGNIKGQAPYKCA